MIALIIVSAIGLLFVFEGVLPFLSPKNWRNIMQHAMIQNDQVLRSMGLISMLIGLVLVWLARNFYS